MVLKTLAVDFVKIDQQFVRELKPGGYDIACAEALCRVAAASGKCIVAEGIESAEVLEHLIPLGVQYGQGWNFGQPQPLRDLLRLQVG